PFGRLLRREKRNSEQDEDSKRDSEAVQTFRRVEKVIDGHSLVEFRERLRVRRLEAHRDFEVAGQKIAKTCAALPDQGRMRLDDHALEAVEKAGDLAMVRWRDRARIEEAPGVVEFDPARR